MGKNKKPKANRKNFKAVVNVHFFAYLMIAIGFIFVIICKIPFGELENKAYVSIPKTIVEPIATTLFSAGVVSLVVEISTISEIVQKALKDILKDKFPFEGLAKERLDDISKQIAFLRTNDENLKEKDILDSPYVLEPELLGLSEGLYYEYHKAKFIITPDDTQGTFKKRVELDYKIINKFGLANSAKITISLISKNDSLTKEELASYFDIKLFKIEESDKIKTNGKRIVEKDLSKEANKYWNVSEIEQHEHSQYKYQIHFEYPLNPDKLTNRIVLMYEYQIPQNDIIQSYKLNYPSRTLEHEITISGNGWEVVGDAYTAFYYPPMYDKEYTVAQTVPTTIRVDFRDWAVPGAGYMATFLKK